MNVAKILVVTWASPLTLCGATYASIFATFGWYEYLGKMDDAYVWKVDTDRSPRWLLNAWSHWGGHTVGQTVIVKNDVDTERGQMVLKHELEHVRQTFILGPFYPIVYGLLWLCVAIACKNSNAYYSNPLEVDARRGAGQVVDVEGTLQKLNEKLRTRTH